jgi:hypothetical protein
MPKEKSLVEETIVQIKNLEDVIAENAKGILRSTMRGEINDLVKESLSEQDEDEIETDLDMGNLPSDDDVEFGMSDDNETLDMDDETDASVEVDDMSMDMDDDEMSFDMEDDDETIDLTGIEDEDEILRVFALMGPEDNIIVTKDDAGNVNLKDEETDKEYMIVGEGEEMEDEFLSDEDVDDEFLSDEDVDDETIEDIVSKVFDESYDELDEEESDEEIVYEIEFDEDDDFEEIDIDEDDEYMMESSMTVKPKGVGIGKVKPSEVKPKPNMKGFGTKMKKANPTMGTGKAKFEFKEGEMEENWGSKKHEYKRKDGKKTGDVKGHYKDYEKEETKEASRTLGSGRRWGRKGLDKPKAAPRHLKVESVNNNELQVLREKNEEYRKALNIFRKKLDEVAIFNSNLAYATRLFTEHSTSKQEKINILRRFDGAETIKESKNLYKTIKEELSTETNTKPINESIGNNIEKTLSTGSAVNLIESKTYENPQFLRMKDLMSKLK